MKTKIANYYLIFLQLYYFHAVALAETHEKAF